MNLIVVSYIRKCFLFSERRGATQSGAHTKKNISKNIIEQKAHYQNTCSNNTDKG